MQLAVVYSVLTHWGHGRTPTNQQIRDLATEVDDLITEVMLLERVKVDET